MKKLLVSLLTVSLLLSLTACTTVPPPAPPANQPPSLSSDAPPQEDQMPFSPEFEYLCYNSETQFFDPTEPTEDGLFLESLIKDYTGQDLPLHYYIEEIIPDQYLYEAYVPYEEGMTATICESSACALPFSLLLLRLPEGANMEQFHQQIYENSDPLRFISVWPERISVHSFANTILLVYGTNNFYLHLCHKLDLLYSDPKHSYYHTTFTTSHWEKTADDFVEDLSPEGPAIHLENLHDVVSRITFKPELYTLRLEQEDYMDYLSIPYEEGMEAYVAMPYITTAPHMAVLLTVPEGTDVKALSAEILENANLRWWIDSMAEKADVAYRKNTIFFVMSTEELVDRMIDRFRRGLYF